MRLFNLTKAGAADDADDEAQPEIKTVPPSRTRLLFLCFLLVVVIALGARNLIGKYIGSRGKPTLPVPTGGKAAPPNQAAVPLSPPPVPAVVATPDYQPRPRSEDEAAKPNLIPTSPTGSKAERDLSQAREASPQDRDERQPSKVASQGRFSVQVGAMAREANALALRKRLEKLGYPSVIRRGRASVTQHVVLVAVTGDRTEADAVTERLRAEGISAHVAEGDSPYRVEAGRARLLDEAIDLARDLQKKGFTPKIASEKVTTPLFLVRVGEFTSRKEARQKGQELRAKGFPVLIVKR